MTPSPDTPATLHGECQCMSLGRATTDCVPSAIAPDIWTQVSLHGPGEAKWPVKVVNRSIIYRLHPPEGAPFLVVLNGLWVDEANDQPFAGLRALEAQTGAQVRFILAPGGLHHLSLAAYARAFPEARVCVADGRIPRVNPALMAEPNVEAYPPLAPPPELAAAGLRLHVVQGLMEGPFTVEIKRRSEGIKGYVPDSTEPVVALHEPSRTLVSGGHQWLLRPEGTAPLFDVAWPMGWVMRKMMGLELNYAVAGAITLECNGNFAVHDRAALQASCREILSWDFDGLLDLHAPKDACLARGGRALYEAALAPIVDGAWEAVPFPEGRLP